MDGGDRNDRLDRKRKSRFGDDEDPIPEKTLIPMVNNLLYFYFLYRKSNLTQNCCKSWGFTFINVELWFGTNKTKDEKTFIHSYKT